MERKKLKEDEKKSLTPFIKSLLVPTPAPAKSDFWPQCQAESWGVIKNLILVGTIIMLVA